MSVPGARHLDDPDRPAAHDGAVIGEPVEQRAYTPPQAFAVGPATRLVRGGLYGKHTDGYTGYYMEP
jgi:hypothetical protein